MSLSASSLSANYCSEANAGSTSATSSSQFPRRTGGSCLIQVGITYLPWDALDSSTGLAHPTHPAWDRPVSPKSPAVPLYLASRGVDQQVGSVSLLQDLEQEFRRRVERPAASGMLRAGMRPPAGMTHRGSASSSVGNLASMLALTPAGAAAMRAAHSGGSFRGGGFKALHPIAGGSSCRSSRNSSMEGSLTTSTTCPSAASMDYRSEAAAYLQSIQQRETTAGVLPETWQCDSVNAEIAASGEFRDRALRLDFCRLSATVSHSATLSGCVVQESVSILPYSPFLVAQLAGRSTPITLCTRSSVP